MNIDRFQNDQIKICQTLTQSKIICILDFIGFTSVILRREKNKKTADSVSAGRSFSLQDAIKAIKDIRKSEMCKKGNHSWIYYPEKKYYSQDYYKCKTCGKKKVVKPQF